MGMRSFTKVISKDTVRIAQYGQWDGTVRSAGLNTFHFIKKPVSEGKVDEFREKVDGCTFIDAAEIDGMYSKMGFASLGPRKDGRLMYRYEDCEAFEKAHPELSRELGCGILGYVMKNGPQRLVDAESFSEYGVSCECSVTVDLDRKTIRVDSGKEVGFSQTESMTDSGFLSRCRKSA